MNNVSFVSNVAGNQGTIYIQDDSTLDLFKCFFSNNKAEDGSAIVANKNQNSVIICIDSQFINNTSVSNLINLLFSNAIFINTLFQDNISKEVNHGITLFNSYLLLDNSLVTYTDYNFIHNNDFQVDTGFFYLIYNSELTLQSNTQIMHTRGAIAASVNAQGGSSI